MNDFVFNTTPSIRQIMGGAAKLGDLINDLQITQTDTHVCFVTDPGIMSLGLADLALENLKSRGIEVTLFDEVSADVYPTLCVISVIPPCGCRLVVKTRYKIG